MKVTTSESRFRHFQWEILLINIDWWMMIGVNHSKNFQKRRIQFRAKYWFDFFLYDAWIADHRICTRQALFPLKLQTHHPIILYQRRIRLFNWIKYCNNKSFHRWWMGRATKIYLSSPLFQVLECCLWMRFGLQANASSFCITNLCVTSICFIAHTQPSYTDFIFGWVKVTFH